MAFDSSFFGRDNIGNPQGAFPSNSGNRSSGAARNVGRLGDTEVGQVDVRTPQMQALENFSLPILAQILGNPLSIAGALQNAIGTPPGAAGFGILNPAMQQLNSFQPQSNPLTQLLFGGAGLGGGPGFEGGQQPGGGVFPGVGTPSGPPTGGNPPTPPPPSGPPTNGRRGNGSGGNDNDPPLDDLISPIGGGGGGALPLAAFGSQLGLGPVFAGGPGGLVGGGSGLGGGNPLDPTNPLNGLINPPQAGDFPFPSAGPGSPAQSGGPSGTNEREALENALVRQMNPNNPFLGPPAALSAPDPRIRNSLDLITQLAQNTGVNNQTAFNRSTDDHDLGIPGLLQALAGIGVTPGGPTANSGQAPKIQNNIVHRDLTGFQARADGGSFSTAQATIVGERGPEAIIPGPSAGDDPMVIPTEALQMAASMAGPAVPEWLTKLLVQNGGGIAQVADASNVDKPNTATVLNTFATLEGNPIAELFSSRNLQKLRSRQFGGGLFTGDPMVPLATSAGPGGGFNPGAEFANVMAAAAPLTGTPILGATDGGAGSANPNNPGLGPQQPDGTGSLLGTQTPSSPGFIPQPGLNPGLPAFAPLPGQQGGQPAPVGGAPGTGGGQPGGTPVGGGQTPAGSSQGLLGQMLQQPAPEAQVFNRAFSGGLGNQLDTNPGQGVMDALQPIFQRNLTDSLGALRNTAPSIFNSATVLEGTDLARRANQDFNLTAAQALMQGAGLQQGAAQTLGGLAGQAGNNPFNRALGAGQQALQLRGQDLGQQLGLLQLGQQQQQFLSNFGLAQNNQAFNQTVNPTLQLLLAALGAAQPTAFQTVASGG